MITKSDPWLWRPLAMAGIDTENLHYLNLCIMQFKNDNNGNKILTSWDRVWIQTVSDLLVLRRHVSPFPANIFYTLNRLTFCTASTEIFATKAKLMPYKATSSFSSSSTGKVFPEISLHCAKFSKRNFWESQVQNFYRMNDLLLSTNIINAEKLKAI